MLYNRYIPETDQNTFINFICNSLILSRIHISHVQIRRSLNKDKEKMDPWVRGQFAGCNEAWKFLTQKKMIQCQDLISCLITINEKLVGQVCRADTCDTRYQSSELNKLRTSEVGGGEISSVPHEEVASYVEKLFINLEKYDLENDKYIMPRRVRFSAATRLARIAWKTQFQIGYICPFFQGNWLSARLLMNILRCHWSLPWLIMSTEDDPKQDEGRAYFDERSKWFDLFNKEGVLTDKFIN